MSGTKHEGKALLRGKVHEYGLDARLIQLQSPQSAQNMAELILSSSKRCKRHTRGYQFSTYFHGIVVFWLPFISLVKIYYPVCFGFQISLGKTTKMVKNTLWYWLHSSHFVSIKPGLVPETHISLQFYPYSMPSNPPTCWRTIASCRKKKVNETRRVLAPQYQTATTHCAVLYILPTFQSQSHAMSTMQSFPAEWLHFGAVTGHLTAQTKPDLLTNQCTPLQVQFSLKI